MVNFPLDGNFISKNRDDLYFIDPSDGDVLLILPTGLEPHEVEVSGDGRIAVVSNIGDRKSFGNTLSAYVECPPSNQLLLMQYSCQVVVSGNHICCL